MKIHFAITCLAYFYFGIGIAVQHMGIKAGMGLNTTIGIFASSVIVFAIVVFTSMQKVKAVLFKKDEPVL